MKYKRLAPEELKELEKEFVNFLSAAQITGPDWVKMKKESVEKAEELIDVFSDLVYDKVLTKIRYLEYRDAKTLNLFHCTDENIVLVGLRVKETSDLDLTAPDVVKKWDEANNASVHLISSEKKYSKERNIEVLEMLESGCLITDDKLFTTLQEMMKK